MISKLRQLFAKKFNMLRQWCKFAYATRWLTRPQRKNHLIHYVLLHTITFQTRCYAFLTITITNVIQVTNLPLTSINVSIVSFLEYGIGVKIVTHT